MSWAVELERTRDSDLVDGIDLDDGTWVDVGPGDRWRPSSGERTRAAVILTVIGLFLASLVLFASLGEGRTREDEVVASTTTTTVATTTTTAPLDPASVAGEAPPEICLSDDRGALPLRERQDSTVLVLNGTFRNGHAAATTSQLERLGYASSRPDNHPFIDVTRILYREGFCAEAVRAADDLGLPGSEIAPLVEEELPVVAGRARLVVVTGRDSL